MNSGLKKTFDKLIYGKDSTEKVVSVEIEDGQANLILEDGEDVRTKTVPNQYWTLTAQHSGMEEGELIGPGHYRYFRKHDSKQEAYTYRQSLRGKGIDFYCAYNDAESFMLRSGVTYFKGLKVEDVSVLSFDIETTGLVHDKSSRVLLISNTFRRNGTTTKRMFSEDEYKSQGDMIDAWCEWVREQDPSLLVGHNIFGFDLPYLHHCSRKGLNLGRDGSRAKISKYTSQFRKDGSQSYDYKNIAVWGRGIIDTFFLSIKYDFKRNYPSYGLKAIIEYEGLQRDGRQFYDAATIKDHWHNPIERAKIKSYCEDDADDALALYDLMIPAYFYYTQSIPKSLQQIINGATGAQVNAMMVRSYLQEKQALPKASEKAAYEGAISFGNPGIYKNVRKADVASLYPSIILQYGVCNVQKDPQKNFLKMVRTFTEERLRNKALSRTTGDRYFSDMEQAQKIFINSAYGFLGAPGLLFNSPKDAALITKKGREILTKGIEWAESNGHQIVNVDTDSFSYKPGRPRNFDSELEDLNSIFPDLIRWEADGKFSQFIVVKAKNYVMVDRDTGKLTTKGSGLKATMKEPALRRFIEGFILLLLDGGDHERLRDYYQGYASLIDDIRVDEIGSWSSKKTITKAVLEPNRTQERRVKEAYEKAGKKVNEGDKIHVYFKTKTELALPETFDGVYCKATLLRKLFKTVEIFKSVVDISLFPNYALKRNQEAFKEVCRGTGDIDAPVYDITEKIRRNKEGVRA